MMRELEFIESFPQGSYIARNYFFLTGLREKKHSGNLRCSCFHCTANFQRISKNLAGDVWRVWQCDPQRLLWCFSF